MHFPWAPQLTGLGKSSQRSFPLFNQYFVKIKVTLLLCSTGRLLGLPPTRPDLPLLFWTATKSWLNVLRSVILRHTVSSTTVCCPLRLQSSLGQTLSHSHVNSLCISHLVCACHSPRTACEQCSHRATALSRELSPSLGRAKGEISNSSMARTPHPLSRQCSHNKDTEPWGSRLRYEDKHG